MIRCHFAQRPNVCILIPLERRDILRLLRPGSGGVWERGRVGGPSIAGSHPLLGLLHCTLAFLSFYLVAIVNSPK